MRISGERPTRFAILIIAFILLLVGMLFLPSLINGKNKGKIVDEKADTPQKNEVTVTPSKNKSKAKETKSISLEIDNEAYDKLKAKRDFAVKKGILLSSDDDFVDAIVTYDDKQYEAEIRIKGDWTQHLEGDTWSFRVKLKNNFTINGMRKFSLQHPKTRNYYGEWLFHEVLKANGILGLRYDFLNFDLIIKNDPDKKTEIRELGFYAIEESFDKQLIEYNKRRAGVLIKIDEDPIWKERRELYNQGLNFNEISYITNNKYNNLNILPFNTNKVLNDETLNGQFTIARNLMEAFVDGDKPVSEIYDLEKLATYNAICNVIGASHSMILHNVRAYYNPINSRLEPIGFDANAPQPHQYVTHFPRTTNNIEYNEIYARKLEEFSSESFYEKLKNWPGLKEWRKKLEKVYPEAKETWNEVLFKKNRKFAQNALFPTKSLNIFYVDHGRSEIVLNIENYGIFPKEINSIKLASGRELGTPKERTVILAQQKETVVFNVNKDFERLFVSKKQGKLKFNYKKDVPKLRVNYKTIGTSKNREEKILAWNTKDKGVLESHVFGKTMDVGKRFPFLIIDEKEKIITCSQSTHQINNDMVIPKGYKLRILPGTVLDMTNIHSRIVSFSPIELLGSPSAPVKIFSKAGKGSGILVLNTPDTSILQNCIFENLAPPRTPNWAQSGAVNFYDAPVKISNSSFSDMRSEDALNIISTTFEMDNVVFTRSFSDAFDGDFVTGTISNSFFDDIGNDAIDVSGSNIHIENVQITRAGDKGVSAGEDSRITAHQLVVSGSEIGIASKDKSEVIVTKCLLKDNKLGFTAYQKKYEFGPGSILADSIELKNVSTDYLIEKNSSLRLNGVAAEVVDRVLDRMYGTEFGKKSQR